jgi:hypothetical protein
MDRTRLQTKASEKTTSQLASAAFPEGSSRRNFKPFPGISRRRIKLIRLLFAHLDDDTTHVMAALGANRVRWCDCATLRAHMKLTGLLGMVGSTLARS